MTFHILDYTIPMFGNIHSTPYCRILIDGRKYTREIGGSITHKGEKYTVVNFGSLYSPVIRLEGKR